MNHGIHRRKVSAASIYKILDEKVIGQEVAKRDLATLLAMHLSWFAKADAIHTAPNALVIGPTGVGKTHAIRTAADALNIPLVIVDATRLSPHGMQGISLEDVLTELISRARRLISDQKIEQIDDLPEMDELEIARRGVVFIDEFDKLTSRSKPTSERNELLQRRLLQFVDGTTVTLNPNPETGEKEVQFSTDGLLFVAAGAFTNLLNDAGKRSQQQMRDMLQHNHVILEDLVRFGFMEELIARLPVIIEFAELQEEDLEEILDTEAVNPSIFYTRYLSSLGTHLDITDQARRYIASRALSLSIGARGLHQVMFPLLSLLSQEIEDSPQPNYVLGIDEVSRLARKVEERRNAR